MKDLNIKEGINKDWKINDCVKIWQSGIHFLFIQTSILRCEEKSSKTKNFQNTKASSVR